MALHLNNPQADCLARRLAKHTGETLTDAVQRALEERWERLTATAAKEEEALTAELNAIAKRFAAASRAAGITKTSRELVKELYDKNGLPR